MKMLLKIAGGILVCLALLLVVFRITGLNPHDRIPGLVAYRRPRHHSGHRLVVP